MSTSDRTNVLLVGGGGREHALAWRLSQSPRLGKLWVTDPQNPGLAALGTGIDVPVDFRQPFRLQRFCDKNNIGLVVIGPEEPLCLGLADSLAAPGRVVFGPSAAAARLEGDKAWCKQLVRNASVPMAEGRAFSDYSAAKNYVETREDPPVIKASGLAKGKGVVVPATMAEALEALERIMVKLEFGEAGRTVVIEERLEGAEASVLSLVDGRNIYVLEPCQDHKRLGDGDTGPNTGGMGVLCPGGITDDALITQIQSEIVVPTVDAMRREGIEFSGVLYAGVMMTPAGPKLLEFNTRFGDPECQALMVRLDSDLIDLLMATGQRKLDEADVRWSTDAVCCVVLASKGYPNRYKTGVPIEGLEAAAAVPGVVVFHAGTRREGGSEGKIVTSGGRVLDVVGKGATLAEARKRAYEACDLIRFEGKTLRRDIGKSAV
jgi:phosphoribosylamine--glycine ligase